MRIAFRTDSHLAPVRGVGRHGASRPFKIALAAVVSLFFLAVLSSFMGDGGFNIVYQQNRAKEELRAKIAAEEQRREALLARLESLKGDPYELERVAREELGLVKQNEVVFDFRTRGLP